MAKKPVPTPTPEQEIAKAIDDLRSFSASPRAAVPSPTRSYVVGEKVRLGNLDDVTVVEVLDEVSYVVRALRHDRHGDSTVYLARWWYDIDKLDQYNGVLSLMSPYRPLPARAAALDGLLHLMTAGGLVCDPKYQRGYVWSEDNKDALIESIFDRLDIGSFLIMSRAGYNHKGSTDQQVYINLDGETISIPKADDYSNVIIDGQQRLTTIAHFVLDKRPYKGVYYSMLNRCDQIEFMNHPIMWRTVDEDNVTEKEVVRMFLQSNRGVPQAPEHLAKVQALYESMKG
jgi:hypothetical protein